MVNSVWGTYLRAPALEFSTLFGANRGHMRAIHEILPGIPVALGLKGIKLE